MLNRTGDNFDEFLKMSSISLDDVASSIFCSDTLPHFDAHLYLRATSNMYFRRCIPEFTMYSQKQFTAVWFYNWSSITSHHRL
jgi:hypothetical protein